MNEVKEDRKAEKETLIKAENMCFSYEVTENDRPNRGANAVNNVSFEIKKGSFTAILGRNGSGKSTLAKLLCMIMAPDSGHLYINGTDMADENVTDEQIYEARRRVGMVFQNPDNQIVASIVEEDVAFGPENLGLPSEIIRKRVDEALENVGMSKYARHSASRLSGGQKQRIAIAGVIAMRRDLIIFDESTAMLDPLGRKEVMDSIIRLNREEGITVIMITHYMNEAILADRVLVMEKGGIIMDDTPKKVFVRAEELWRAGLDVPQTTELLRSLKKSGLDVSLDAFEEKACAEEIKKALAARGACPVKKSVVEGVTGVKEENTAVTEDGVAARFENVTFTYSKGTAYETTAVDGVSLDIYKGRITGIIGATGSGKSTLIQMLNGLIKPDSGKIYIDGTDIHSKKVKMRDIRFKVGLVMQYPEYQLFDETVYGDIAFGPKNMGIEGDELKKRVLSAAKFSGVTEDLLNKSPFELSGGQKRRAALAGVIAMNPSVLVLDEPAAGLDPAGRTDILDGIRAFQRESGICVIIVSHSMEDMAKYCDRLVVISNGKVLMNGDKAEVFSRDSELLEAGLDVPQITRVAKELDSLGIHIDDGVYTVGYAAEKLVQRYGL